MSDGDIGRGPEACGCDWANWHRDQVEKLTGQLKRTTETQPTRDEMLEITGYRKKKQPPGVRIPRLKDGNVRQYIAAISRAVAAGQLTAAQGNGLLYAAQVFISLRGKEQPPPPPPIGFRRPTK